MKRAVEFLLGGAIVYVAMAAQAAGCAGSGPDGGLPSAQAGASGGGDGGFGGAPGNPSGGNGGVVAQAGSSGSGGIFDPVPDAEAKSGTRLKAMRYTGADGSELTAPVWLDSERNEQCTFQTAADGKTRCIPSFAGSASTIFTNSSCTSPGLLTTTSCDASNYVGASTVINCASGTRIFQKGQPTSTYYTGSPASCSGPLQVTAGLSAYQLTEVPPTSFVEVTLSQVP